MGRFERDILADLRRRAPFLFRPTTEAEEQLSRDHEARLALLQGRRPDAAPQDDFGRIVGERYAGCRLSNFEVSCAEQARVLAVVEEYANQFPQCHSRGTNLILFGPCGTGKDHLAAGLAWDVWQRYGIPIVHKTGLALFAQVRDRINTGDPEGQLVERLADAPVLLLSDPPPPRGALTEWQAALLLRIVDARYREKRVTWLTINVATGKEADDRLGAQVADRLRDGAVVLFCNWPSYRRPAAER